MIVNKSSLGITYVVIEFIILLLLRSSAFADVGMRCNLTKIQLGPPSQIYGSDATTWAKVDCTEKVVEVGFNLNMVSIENAPTDPVGGFIAAIEFPEIVKATTFFNHVGLWWEPHGH